MAEFDHNCMARFHLSWGVESLKATMAVGEAGGLGTVIKCPF